MTSKKNEYPELDWQNEIKRRSTKKQTTPLTTPQRRIIERIQERAWVKSVTLQTKPYIAILVELQWNCRFFIRDEFFDNHECLFLSIDDANYWTNKNRVVFLNGNYLQRQKRHQSKLRMRSMRQRKKLEKGSKTRTA